MAAGPPGTGQDTGYGFHHRPPADGGIRGEHLQCGIVLVPVGQLSRQPLGTRPVTRLSLKPQLIQVAVLGKQGRERGAEAAVKGSSPAREFPDIHATGS